MTPFPPAVLPVGVALALKGGIGAQALPYVGDDSDITRFDPAGTEGVRVAVAALGAEIVVPRNVYAAVRVEEGVVHAGGLEAAEMRVGWRLPDAGIWVGRADIPLTYDRGMEAEELTFSVRPVLSRSILPLHATGVGGEVAWRDRLAFSGGSSFSSLTSDAPWWWGRAAVHPLGELPEQQDAPAPAPRAQLGVGGAWLDSASLGRQWFATADLALRWGPVDADVGWIRADTGAPREEWLGGLGGRLFGGPEWDIHLAGRAERVTGLEVGEDARWIETGRLALRLEDRQVETYVEFVHSEEIGSAVASGDDVVLLNDSIERANDTCALGALVRFR